MESSNFAKGVLIGAIAGVIGGVLLTPKSGREMRQDIRETFEDIKEQVIRQLQEAKEFSREMYDQSVRRAVSGYETAKKITPNDAKKIRDIFDQSYSEIEKIVKKDIKKIKSS
jgi:gas vesicle protein